MILLVSGHTLKSEEQDYRVYCHLWKKDNKEIVVGHLTRITKMSRFLKMCALDSVSVTLQVQFPLLSVRILPTPHRRGRSVESAQTTLRKPHEWIGNNMAECLLPSGSISNGKETGWSMPHEGAGGWGREGCSGGSKQELSLFSAGHFFRTGFRTDFSELSHDFQQIFL